MIEVRLIDANALKEVIFSKTNGMEDLWDTAGVLNAINKAPTVEPFERIGAICNENCGYKPQGEWIETSSYDENIICSLCKTEFNGDIKLICGGENPNFCPECGADMRGGAK